MQTANNKQVNKMKNFVFTNMLKCAAVILSSFLAVNAYGQIYFAEDFEEGKIPETWNQEKDTVQQKLGETLEWVCDMGGPYPAGSEVGKPEEAQHGDFNVVFYRNSMEFKYSTYLITPTIDLTNAKKPLLTFYYSLYPSKIDTEDNFEFSLCYRKTPSSPWTTYRSYNEPTDDMEPWRCDSIYLPDSLCGNFKIQLAFLGKTKTVGLGVCIDNIKIVESLVINKHVSSIYPTQPNTNMLPTSSTDNAVLMLRLPVVGNSGTLNFNSMTLTALQQTEASVKPNSMKLYYTTNNSFRIDKDNNNDNKPDNLLATTTITNGKATFSNIHFDLPPGNTYVWVTCDIKDEDGDHRLRNNIVAVQVDANSIHIGDSTYPKSVFKTEGQVVNESIFFDNFEIANANWTNTGEFERATPQGLGGDNGGNADPDYARSGSYILGTDIIGHGDGLHSHGNYEKNLGAKAYTATTKTFDCYYYKDINILLYRWLNIANGDAAAVSYSTLNDEETSWFDAWRTSIKEENKWTFQKHDIHRKADHNKAVSLQLSLGPTSDDLQYSGWNVDDFALVGTYIYYDAAITDIVAPQGGCGLSTEEDVTIMIQNAGFNDIETPFDVSYRITYNGNTSDWVTETISDGMVRDEERPYTFTTKANLSNLGEYTIETKVQLADDEFSPNNGQQISFLSLPYHNLPYAEDFNTSHGYWYGYGENSTWEYGTLSGVRCWHTKQLIDKNTPIGYPAGDSAWLESPCFNLSNVQKPMLSFKLKADAANTDGLAVYYSTDNGATWTLIPYGTSYPRLSWYNTNSNIAALGTKGWTGDFDWTFIQQILPNELAGESSVKLKFLFQSVASDEPTNHSGFAIDDIGLYEAPADAGVAEIVTPVSKCYLDSTQQITVRIKNYGIRGITRADSLFTSLNIKYYLDTIKFDVSLIDTFLLAINDTIKVNESKDFTFNQKVNMWDKNDYVMTAYTDVIGDTLLFEDLNVTTSNDTTRSTATVWGEPAYTLGPDIGTLNPTAISIFGGKQSDGNLFKSYLWEPLKDSANLDIVGGHISIQPTIGLDDDKLPDFPSGKGKGYYYEYQITVTTQEHDCEAKDTIRIIMSETDISIDNIAFEFDYPEEGSANPQEFTRPDAGNAFGNTQYCISKQPEKVTVTVKNNANVQVDPNEKISIYYTYFANTIPYVEDTIMENGLPAGESFEYTFKQAPKITHGIKQDLHFFVRIKADMDPTNDSATINVNAWPLPVAELGDDSLLVANPIDKVLATPNIAGANYKWLLYEGIDENLPDGLNDGQRTANPYEMKITESLTQKYWVEVTDEHECGTAYDTILIVSDNWKIDEIITPVSQCEPTDTAKLRVTINNLSAVNRYEAGFHIPATITINGEVTNEIIELKNAIEPLDPFVYTFDTPIDMSEPGKYSISVRINPTHDINTNDNISYEDANIWGVWQVDIGADTIFTLEADTITLYAKGKDNKFDNGKFMSYMWTTAASTDTITEDNYTIPDYHNAIYKLQVTDFHNCPSSRDSVVIIPFDLAITEILSPQTACEINSFTTAELSLYYNGRDSLIGGGNYTIPIKVQIDNGTITSFDYSIEETLKTGESQVVSFHYVPTFDESLTEHTVKMWVDWELDQLHNNDTKIDTILQYSHPEPFSLGDDIYTARPDTVRLIAPFGYPDYVWSTDYTGNNILNIEYTGSSEYWVRVLNSYSCMTADTMMVFSNDITMRILSGAINSCSPVIDQPVKAQIEINRNNVIPGGTRFTASYSINGISETKEIILPQDTSITYTTPYQFFFDNNLTIADTGNYVLTTDLIVHNAIDVISNNKQTINVRLGAYPLPFQDTVRTYDEDYVIDAGPLFALFNWEGESSAVGRYLSVVTSNKYILHAVDTNGCATTDSTYILFVVPSYEISGLGFASTMCEPDGPIEISFYVKNTGNDKVNSGTVIPVSYKIDDKAAVAENFSLPKTLWEGDTILIKFNTKADVRETGSYTMILNADVNGYETSSLKTITVMENPSPDLGEDINTDKDSWQLTPGINFGQFLWSTGETNYYIDVTTSGDYWVTVTNNYGCSANDTVSVHFTEPEVSVAAFNSAAAYCGDIVDQNFEINLSNSGVKNVAAGHTIGITCAVGDTTVADSITLPNDFFAGASFNHKLAVPVSIKGVGAHTLAFTVSIDGKQTDISAFTVNIYDFPTFQFASDELVVDEYPYTLTAPVANAGYLWSDGSTESSISVSEDGTYSLTVTDANNCSASSSINIKLKIIDNPGGGGGNGGGGGTTPPGKDTTAINSLAEGEIGIYPNPADDIINIDFSQSQLTGSRIWIMSVTGKVLMTDVQTSDIMRIDISNWPQGIYIIKVVNGGSSGFIKFVKR